MPRIPLQEIIGNIDIYLLDQIMKERYQPADKILDAGCGSGRNMFWFLKNNFEVYAVDKDPVSIDYLHSVYPNYASERFVVAGIEKLPFENEFFDHIISSAVLHFAQSASHFSAMIKEMVRVLKTKGSLFIRMTSNIGIEKKVKLLGDGVYEIPDGSIRFLLTPDLLTKEMNENHLTFLEPLKTVNVDNIRCMSTLVLMKNQWGKSSLLVSTKK